VFAGFDQLQPSGSNSLTMRKRFNKAVDLTALSLDTGQKPELLLNCRVKSVYMLTFRRKEELKFEKNYNSFILKVS